MSSKSRKYKIGVIGAGAIAQACHIPGYLAAKNCKVAAVADSEKERFAELKKNKLAFGSAYTDWREMLEKEQLDAVSICTPNWLHAETAEAVLATGCDLLLEKPIALSMEEAYGIKRAADKSSSRIMVAFSHRFNHLNVEARKALKKGIIGKPYMTRIRFAHSGPFPGWARSDWFYRPEYAGGGAMMDMAIHAFDLAQWYLGPAQSVQASIKTLRKKIEVDDNAVAILEFGGNCLGYIEVSWTSHAGFAGVELMGDNGAMIVDYSAGEVRVAQGISSPDGSLKMKNSILAKMGKETHWQAQMKYFTGMLGSRKKLTPDLDDGIASLRIACAAYESSSRGNRIALT